MADKEGREVNKFDYLYQYADIKLNVMMSYEGMSMYEILSLFIWQILHQLHQVNKNNNNILINVFNS